MLTILMPLRFIFLATNADQLSERSPFQTKALSIAPMNGATMKSQS